MTFTKKAPLEIPDECLHLHTVNSRHDLFHMAWQLMPDQNGTVAEFGVGKGGSAEILGRLFPPNQLHFFDTFTGLPEDWHYGGGKIINAGAFNQNGQVPPLVPVGSHVNKGLFKDTLPGYFAPDSVSFIHIDCDLYSSTVDILTHAREFLRDGAMILFDELFGYPNWAKGEYLALKESGFRYEWVARDNWYRALCRYLK